MNLPGPGFAFTGAVPPPPPPPSFGVPGAAPSPNNFPPTMAVAPPLAPTPAPVAVDWEAKARELIQAKVYIDGKPITAQPMVVWAYTEIAKRMGNPPEVAKQMAAALEQQQIGAINLGNDNEEALSMEQRQAKVLELIPTKLTWQGNICAGTPEYLSQVLGWLWTKLAVLTSITDNNQKMVALHNWLRNINGTYELDDAARAAAVQKPPANPVSDQATQQQAAPVAPAAPAPGAAAEDDKEDPVIDPVDGTKCKNLRGLKTRVTRTHKVEWGAFCAHHQLDPTTGRKKDGAPTTPGPVGIPTGTPPPPVSQPLPALVGHGAPVTAPAVNLDNVGVNTLYDAQGNKTPAYAAAQGMPVPPAQQPTTPVAVTPTFQASAPAAPYVGTPAPGTAPVAGTPGLPPSNVMQPQVITPTFDAPVQQPQTQQLQVQVMQPVVSAVGMDRSQMATALGGPVRLIVCRLLEINSVNLTGFVDANQLALLAEKNARAELRIQDLAQAQYGAGKQSAQRHFADLLNKNPQCYLLMNGYEFIIPDGFLEILIARTVYVYHASVRDGAIEIKF